MEQCLSPPALGKIGATTNVNLCHVYTWNSFPTRTDHYAVTPLFNDSSYDFFFNSTNLVAYDLCGDVITPTQQSGDSELVPQILTVFGFQELHGSLQATGVGDMPLYISGALVPGECSGYTTINQTLISNNIIPGENHFRIAGESGLGIITPQLSMLTLQMFFNRTVTPTANTQASITCNTGTVATNGFTARCTLGAGTAVSNIVVSMAWQANLLGASFQSGSGSCTITAGTQSCTKAFPFSPTFVTPPSVILDWNPGLGQTNLPVPSIVQVSTIINILS